MRSKFLLQDFKEKEMSRIPEEMRQGSMPEAEIFPLMQVWLQKVLKQNLAAITKP
jgi:hypothetical protein